ncbi:hypothetical protein HDU89_003209 [Geranomyces variabilis]|nr:hypothetical protein HDU89_003209 [Geranomyces variabilis]
MTLQWVALPPPVLAKIVVFFTSTQELLKFTSVCRSFRSAPLPQHYAQVLRRQFYHDRRPMLCPFFFTYPIKHDPIPRSYDISCPATGTGPALPLCVRYDPAVDGPSPVATKFFYNTVRKLMAMDTCWNSESPGWETEEPVLLQILRFGLVPLAQDLIDSGMRFRHEGSDGIKCAVMSNNFLAVKFAVEQKLDTRFARRNMPPAPLAGALEGALDMAIKVENNQIIDYILQMVRENTLKPYILGVTEDTLIKLIDDKNTSLLEKLLTAGSPVAEAAGRAGMTLDFDMARWFHAKGCDMSSAFLTAVLREESNALEFAEMCRQWLQESQTAEEYHETIQIGLEHSLFQGSARGAEYMMEIGADMVALNLPDMVEHLLRSRRPRGMWEQGLKIIVEWLKKHPDTPWSWERFPNDEQYSRTGAQWAWDELVRLFPRTA